MAKKTTYVKRYKCPYCELRIERAKLADHIDKKHKDMIPQGYTSTRVAFNTVNKKEVGHCIICGKETAWNEDKQRYERICDDKKCNKEYVDLVNRRLMQTRGVTKQQMLEDPEFQNKMLQGRKISGTYKFSDGGKVPYVGSYEKKFLEFMDVFLHIESKDISAPGPTIEYYYEGKKHMWITDFYYIPYNLVLDIKDGGKNPNKRQMDSYRAKQIAKEKAIKSDAKYNYLRLTDNQFDQLIEIMIEMKESLMEYDTWAISEIKQIKPIVKIYESAIQEGHFNQVFITRYRKPYLKPEQFYKMHQYPGMLNMVKHVNTIEDLNYLKRDYVVGKRTITLIKERIDKCNKLGDCKETHSYYNGIKKQYIDKGITSKDIELYMKWGDEVYFKAINDKIKTLKQAQKESALLEQEYHVNTPNGYFALFPKKPTNLGWDEEQTYPTIGKWISGNKPISGNYFVYDMNPDTYDKIYLGQIHINYDPRENGYDFIWLEVSGDNTAPIGESSSIITKNIDTVIFDLGGVLIDDTFHQTLLDNDFIPNEYVDQLEKTWIEVSQQESEQSTREYIIGRVAQQLPIEMRQHVEEVAKSSIASFKPYDYTERLLTTLKENGYKIYYLSNWGRWHCEELQSCGKMDFLKYFDGGIFSYQVNAKKPDSDIYRIFKNKTSVNGDNAIFFDDRPENVEGAINNGIEKAVVFEPSKVKILFKDILNNKIDTVEESSAPEMSNVIIKKPSNITPTQDGYINKKGLWNSVLYYKDEILRERVECIILNKDRTKMMLGYTDHPINGRSRVGIPGGGSEKDLSLEEQVINECREEVYANITNVEYINSYIRLAPSDFNEYTGAMNHVYVAEYAGRFTGHVDDVDKDSLAHQVKWYPIDKGLELLLQYNEKIHEIMCGYFNK